MFWINDPMILFKQDDILNVWPTENMNKVEKLNAISRLVIILTIIGFIFTQSIKIIVTGFITLGVLIFLYFISEENNKKNENNDTEGFCNMPNLNEFYIADGIREEYTQPTNVNPTMNVLLPEIQDNPDRKQAAPSFNPVINEEINNSTKELIKKNFQDDPDIDKKLFNDLGDNFEFEQSMRQFYTTANTTIPNNQKDFAEFCYESSHFDDFLVVFVFEKYVFSRLFYFDSDTFQALGIKPLDFLFVIFRWKFPF
mgnify:CR=1 FL=1